MLQTLQKAVPTLKILNHEGLRVTSLPVHVPVLVLQIGQNVFHWPFLRASFQSLNAPTQLRVFRGERGEVL